jgi:hypothetical protein
MECRKTFPFNREWNKKIYANKSVRRIFVEEADDQRSDGRLVTAVDYLIYSMASAELKTLSEESHEVLNTYKAIVSSSVRTLLA